VTEEIGLHGVRGIQTESVITVDGDCYLSCSFPGDEFKFLFGPVHNGLTLYMTWDGLAKFLSVLSSVIARIGEALPGKPVELSISADEPSRLAHGPNI
jgi:hypothetical protein